MTMPIRLDDETVAALQPTWDGHQSSFRISARAPAGAPAAVRVLENLTTLSDLGDLLLLANGLAADGTRATDAGGYTLDGDVIVAWDAGENRVALTRQAFTGLMIKLLDEAGRALSGDERVASLADLAASLKRREDERPTSA